MLVVGIDCVVFVIVFVVYICFIYCEIDLLVIKYVECVV